MRDDDSVTWSEFTAVILRDYDYERVSAACWRGTAVRVADLPISQQPLFLTRYTRPVIAAGSRFTKRRSSLSGVSDDFNHRRLLRVRRIVELDTAVSRLEITCRKEAIAARICARYPIRDLIGVILMPLLH